MTTHGGIRGAGVAGLLALAACGIVPVGGSKIALQTESYPWVDPWTLRTWAWSPKAQSLEWATDEQQARLIDWRIRGAVERGMAARWYAAVQSDTADLIVRYRISVEEASTSSVQEYLSYRAEGGTGDMGESLMGYERGTLLLEIYERATRRLAWRGTASAVVKPDATGERPAEAVADLLAVSPPRLGDGFRDTRRNELHSRPAAPHRSSETGS